MKPINQNVQYAKRDKFKGCRDNKNKKQKKQKQQEGLAEVKPVVEPVEQPVVHESVWQAIDDVVKQAAEMKKVAENNNLEKTIKKYDKAMASLSSAQKQVAKAEELKKKETEKKDKPTTPKKEKVPPYKEVFVETIEIDGKKKDKYDVQKTPTSPILTKYRVHKPQGLNEEQVSIVNNKLNELKETITALNDDFTEAQFKKVVTSFFKKNTATAEQRSEGNAETDTAESDEELQFSL